MTVSAWSSALSRKAEISLDKASGPRADESDGAKTRTEFSASFKLQLFFQAVQALAEETDVVDVEQDTSVADASDPATLPGVDVTDEPATTDDAIGVLEQVVDASLEQVVEAAPAESEPATTVTQMSLSAMAKYESAANGSFRMSLSINLVA